MELKNTSDNLHIYRQVQTVPKESLKPFTTSYGKELTEINAMWRIMKLTELFGPAGEGWYTEVTRQEKVAVPNGEVMVFVDLNLYLKDTKTGKWSKPIRGTGGNRLVRRNDNGTFYCDDEAYKMAYTDALGVACKSLGFGADIYSGKFDSKYTSGSATLVSKSVATEQEAVTAAASAAPAVQPSETDREEAQTDPQTGAETSEEQKPKESGKRPLTQSSTIWPQMVTWAASKAQMSAVRIHREITKKYIISDDDFCYLMQTVGKDVTAEDLKQLAG